MATTIPLSFQRFRSNLEITALQQSTVSTRQQNVRDAVASRLTVKESFLTGSYERHTMITPLSDADVDICVVLDASYYQPDGHAALLDRVRSVLLETYPTTPKISRNGQAVTIPFTDFAVDVVPAFYRQGGGFLIPSMIERRWVPTNPQVHGSFMSTANAAHDGDLVPIIKMFKAWNRVINRAFRSFYLELLVQQALDNVLISNDWSGCRYAFGKGRELIKFKIADPAGLDQQQVQGLASAGSVQAGVSRFETAYNTAWQAERLAGDGRTREAVEEWRKVFRGYFPAYG